MIAEVLVILVALTAEMTGAAVAVAPPKKTPANTAFSPPVNITWMITFPFTFQEAYSPLLKLENVCVLSTACVPASRMETASALDPASQSSKYSAILCVFPSVRFTLTLKLPAA